MDNVIASLAAKVSPEAMSTPAPTALKVGHLNHGLTLFETFGDEDKEQTKVESLQTLACHYALSCEDFKGACKKALEMADAADKASGFLPKDEAKGVEKYGPKRRVLNQRLSEAKQLFGVFKLNPDTLRERGYWSALSIAREYLNEGQIKWDATRIVDTEEKAQKAVFKAQRDALDEVMSMYVQKPGESIREYMERMATKVDAQIEVKRQEAFEGKVNTLVKSLLAKHEDSELLLTACMRILEQASNLEEVIAYFAEAKMLQDTDVLKQAAEHESIENATDEG